MGSLQIGSVLLAKAVNLALFTHVNFTFFSSFTYPFRATVLEKHHHSATAPCSSQGSSDQSQESKTCNSDGVRNAGDRAVNPCIFLTDLQHVKHIRGSTSAVTMWFYHTL